MWKVILFSIFALGTALAIPSVRQRVQPYLTPVTRKLQPVTTRLTTPTKKWQAKNEAGALLAKLSEDEAQKKELPSALEFRRWIRTRTQGEHRGNDPWGRPYYLIHESSQITVGSPGPDRKRNTPDDVRVSAPIH